MIETKDLGLDEYQALAARTISCKSIVDMLYHSLHGMSGEIGEIHSLFQKEYQGHPIEKEHLKKELGDLMWFIAEFCTSMSWNMSEVGSLNIEKLKARYPDGFEVERSLHRAEGDV